MNHSKVTFIFLILSTKSEEVILHRTSTFGSQVCVIKSFIKYCHRLQLIILTSKPISCWISRFYSHILCNSSILWQQSMPISLKVKFWSMPKKIFEKCFITRHILALPSGHSPVYLPLPNPGVWNKKTYTFFYFGLMDRFGIFYEHFNSSAIFTQRITTTSSAFQQLFFWHVFLFNTTFISTHTCL